jgi:zona occludens toxin (predicted ATPase)
MKKRISVLLMATMLMGTFTQFVYAEDNTKNVAAESYASATENTESTSNSYITHNATLEVGKAVSPSNPVCLKIYPNDAIEAD